MSSNWFKDAIVYQIYPKSFMDSNNDGIGDIGGIISKLDYLKSLGINCVWLSPIYESPMDDNGYDISNYRAIHKDFGTMEDFQLMLSEMHKRGIRLIMDLVVNHTSSEHPWFKEAKKSKDNPYRDYYIWRKKPNNWTGFFGDKAWEKSEETGEYYLHLFNKTQPDLNWENPKVIKEVKDIMRFWLDKGVDGFRCDVINLISKDQRFKNGMNPLILVGKKYFINGPRLHEFLKGLNNDVLSKYDAMTVGETVMTSLEDCRLLTDLRRNELSMVFNFDHTDTDNYLGVKFLLRKFKLKRLKRALDKYQYGLANEGWNSLFYENHDQRRSVGRFNTSDKSLRVEGAKMLANTFYFMKGTPFIYQGQEIGMTNMDVESIDEFEDVELVNVLATMRKLHLSEKYIDKSIRWACRDNARVPLSWDDSEFAGFSTHTPWLKCNSNKDTINVRDSINDPNSILNYYRELIKLHKEYSNILKNGKYEDLSKNDNKVFLYSMSLNNEMLVVVSSFINKEIKYNKLNEYLKMNHKLLLSNYNSDTNILAPYESRIYYIKRR